MTKEYHNGSYSVSHEMIHLHVYHTYLIFCIKNEKRQMYDILYLSKNKRMRLYSKDSFSIKGCTVKGTSRGPEASQRPLDVPLMYMKPYEVTFGMRLYLGVSLFLGKYSITINVSISLKQYG